LPFLQLKTPKKNIKLKKFAPSHIHSFLRLACKPSLSQKIKKRKREEGESGFVVVLCGLWVADHMTRAVIKKKDENEQRPKSTEEKSI